jgi:hypothetical protein
MTRFPKASSSLCVHAGRAPTLRDLADDSPAACRDGTSRRREVRLGDSFLGGVSLFQKPGEMT